MELKIDRDEILCFVGWTNIRPQIMDITVIGFTNHHSPKGSG